MDSVSLAEPRRRQKWTLNPRGNLWANDESKFGQKLMEKMGWEKGKGLGANENGRVEHISARLKDNNKGIGFEGHDDTWLAHQNDFQSVLAALNIQHGEAGKDMSESDKKANLEELSKKSKKRVHYQKFVRGKDTNNYSVDDLECILGTKSDKVKKPKPEEDKEAAGEEEEDKKFIQGGSYADYFAKKMAALKAKGKFSSVDTDWVSPPSAVKDDECEVQRIGFSGTDSAAPDQADNSPDINDEEPMKTKKKSKKSKKENRDEEDNVIVTPPESSEDAEVTIEKGEKKKKKKSKKSKEEEPEVVEPHPEIPPTISQDETEAPKKKKKSKKSKEANEYVGIPQEEEVSEPAREDTQKKQKKSKKKKREEEEENQNVVEPVLEEEEIKKKKSKKSKKEKVAQVEEAEDDSGLENDDTKYKKQKKVKKEKTKEKKTTYSDEEKENRKKRKSETEDEAPSPVKKIKTAQEEDKDNRTKFAGFKGSNLLSIPGYGVNES